MHENPQAIRRRTPCMRPQRPSGDIGGARGSQEVAMAAALEAIPIHGMTAHKYPFKHV